jgi:hypothetical protein
MRKTACTLLPGLLLAAMLALAPVPLLAAVYKCEHNGQVVYGDTPCGKAGQMMKAGVTVVPAIAPPAKPSSPVRDLVGALGLDTRGGVITALLFGIPLSFVIIFFLTRKSER